MDFNGNDDNSQQEVILSEIQSQIENDINIDVDNLTDKTQNITSSGTETTIAGTKITLTGTDLMSISSAGISCATPVFNLSGNLLGSTSSKIGNGGNIFLSSHIAEVNTGLIKDLSGASNIQMNTNNVLVNATDFIVNGNLSSDISTSNQVITNLITSANSSVVLGGSSSFIRVNNCAIQNDCNFDVSVDALSFNIDADVIPSTTSNLGRVDNPWLSSHITELNVNEVKTQNIKSPDIITVNSGSGISLIGNTSIINALTCFESSSFFGTASFGTIGATTIGVGTDLSVGGNIAVESNINIEWNKYYFG